MERPFKEHDTSSSMTAAYVLHDMVRATTSSVRWIRLERLDLRENMERYAVARLRRQDLT